MAIEPQTVARSKDTQPMKKFYLGAIAIGAPMALVACSAPEAEVEETPEATEAEATETVADEPTEPVEFTMADISCWDLTTTDDDEQAFAATLVYGYVAGAAGQNEQSSEGITAAIGSALDYCVENPDATAMEAFSQGDD